MKISKAAVLTLGWIISTAGLGLLVVNAATTDQYKDLLLDLNNAVQHFETVRFITQTNSSQVDMKRVGWTDPLMGIGAENFAVVRSWANWNKIWGAANNVLNTILWWVDNEINGWSAGGEHVILWWESNKVYGTLQDVILWWKWNTIRNGASRSVIAGWERNTIDNSVSSSTIVWSNNTVKGNNSVAVWKNNTVEKENSAVLWSNGTVKGSSSFLWTNDSLTVTDNNVFVVNWKNGMVIGGNKAHSFAKLTVSGSLVVWLVNNLTTCNSNYKWVVKMIDNTNNWKKCFCSCDGSGWNSLNGKWSCINVCAGTNNNLQAKCWTSTSCTDKEESYQWSCDVWQLVQWEWGHFIDKNNQLHWRCIADNGSFDDCVGDVPNWCPSSSVGPECGDAPNPVADACRVWVLVPNDEDKEWQAPYIGEDGLDHWFCKNGVTVTGCVNDGFCGDRIKECENGSTWLGYTSECNNPNPEKCDPNYDGKSWNLQWTCKRWNVQRICRKQAKAECGTEYNRKVVKFDTLDVNSSDFRNKMCTRWNPWWWKLEGAEYTRWCESGGKKAHCNLYLYPKCSTTGCEIWNKNPVNWGQWRCTNQYKSVLCPWDVEWSENTWSSCRMPYWWEAFDYLPMNVEYPTTWEEIKPTTWDETRKCYDAISGGTARPHSCEFKCKQDYYCTESAYSVGCAKPSCVGKDDIWDLAHWNISIWWTPKIGNEKLDNLLTMKYEFMEEATSAIDFHNRVTNLDTYGSGWCFYRCPQENRYEWKCYSTWEVYRLTHEVKPWVCTGDYRGWYVYEREWTPTTWKEIPRLYVPRRGGVEWDQAIINNEGGCLWTCDNAANGQEIFHEENGFVSEDSNGDGTWITKSEPGPDGEDCRTNCGEGEIYWSKSKCHTCKSWNIPNPNQSLWHYNQPLRCIEYKCPSNYELDTSSYNSSAKTYKGCVCKYGLNNQKCKVNNYDYSRFEVRGNYRVCVHIDGYSWGASSCVYN